MRIRLDPVRESRHASINACCLSLSGVNFSLFASTTMSSENIPQVMRALVVQKVVVVLNRKYDQFLIGSHRAVSPKCKKSRFQSWQTTRFL